ncbi:LysR family transcriptional regulator [Kribbella catacumbae]|uniref:LysR family transcriptional regulator n=1 Tax=Kribbella catacumbae TaxID=460086 RepID=UPI00037D0A75|nr:LysR family transcriptional regulator [Kribbella catacumbae]
MRYDLDDLRLFVFVVDQGSITAGSAQMHLSLPSASARVRALEAQAGVPLLIRERRGVRPTPAGTTLARHAREVLAQTARLDSAVASYTAARSRPLVLVSGGSAMHRVVPAALASFLREYPEHDVTVSEQRTPRSLQLLAEGKADLGIVLDDEETMASALRTEPLADDSLVVIGQSGGVLSGRQTMSYAEVAEHPMIGLDLGSTLRTWMDRRLGPHAPAPRYRTLVPTVHTLITLAEAGVGLAIAPLRSVDRAPTLDICRLTDPWSTRSHLICYAPSGPTPAITALAHHIHQAATT